MANLDRPNGARVVGTLSGSPWEASVESFTLDATHTAIGVGDLVQMTTDGYLNVYTSGTGFIGVCVGVQPVQLGVVGGKADNFLSRTEPTLTGTGAFNVALNTVGTILVVTAPDAIIEMQEDGVGGALAVADIGVNLAIVNGGINSATGKSTMELDSSSKAATNTLPLRLLSLVQTPENELGTNARWLVTPANHFYSGLNVGLA